VMVKTKKYDSGGEKLKSLISEEIKFSKLNWNTSHGVAGIKE
jgi:hypothetical protein